MALFSVKDKKLTPVKEQRLDLERNLQKLTEENLETIFGYKFVYHELPLHGLRIDTLAYNPETRSFVIIEYKRDRSFSVIDQGYAYLSLVLNNKADFILEYNENQKDNLKRDDVDWSQTRVIFLANSFTVHQKNAINFKDLPIELWEVKKYDNGTVLYSQLQSPDSSESIKTVSRSETVEKVSREVKNYSVDDHFKLNWKESREIFDQLRPKILELDPRLVESPQKYYIGYKINTSVAFNLKAFKSGIQIELNRVEPKDIKDPEKLVKYVKDSFKFYNKHVSYYWMTKPDQTDYAIFLAKQILEKFYK